MVSTMESWSSPSCGTEDYLITTGGLGRHLLASARKVVVGALLIDVNKHDPS